MAAVGDAIEEVVPLAAAERPELAGRWRREFPGKERELGEMRRWLASLLPACAARDDVTSVATELAANAIVHTASGDGGWFAVEVTWLGLMVRVAVADGGNMARPRAAGQADDEHGRGLTVVAGLSLRCGISGDCQGRTAWAEIAWDEQVTLGCRPTGRMTRAMTADDESKKSWVCGDGRAGCDWES